MAAITRADYRTALYAILDTYRTAHPEQLRSVYRYRPGSIRDAPAGWVGTVTEDMTYSAGLRATIFAGEVTLANPFPTDLINADDVFDGLEAGLKEAFIAGVHQIPNTLLILTTASDGEETFGGDAPVIYRAMTLTTRLEVWEGRLA